VGATSLLDFEFDEAEEARMACPTCDELDQQIMLLRSRLLHAEDPSIRNKLEQQEAALVHQLTTHKVVCEGKPSDVR